MLLQLGHSFTLLRKNKEFACFSVVIFRTYWWNDFNLGLLRIFSFVTLYWYFSYICIFMTKRGFMIGLGTRQIWGIWKLRPACSPETLNLGQNRWCFVPCDLEIGWMTLENNRASLLCCFKLCATFHSHWWIQTGVTVRKRPIWVKFDDF